MQDLQKSKIRILLLMALYENHVKPLYTKTTVIPAFF